MEISIKNLMTVRTWAEKMGKTTAWAYVQIKAGKVKSIEIDKVKFVVSPK